MWQSSLDKTIADLAEQRARLESGLIAMKLAMEHYRTTGKLPYFSGQQLISLDGSFRIEVTSLDGLKIYGKIIGNGNPITNVNANEVYSLDMAIKIAGTGFTGIESFTKFIEN